MAYIYSPWKRIEPTSGSSNVSETNAYGYVCEITLDAGTETSVYVDTPAFDFPINSFPARIDESD